MKRNKKSTDIPPSVSPLSQDELDMLKKSIDSEDVDVSQLPHYDNSDKAKLVRYIKKNKIFSAVCISLAVLIIVSLVLCVVFAVGKAADRPNTDDFTVTLGSEKYTVKYKDAMRSGVLYIDMYRVARFAELTRTGSDISVKFTADEDNYLRFENGEQTAVINGNLVDLGGTAVVSRDVCEIPLDFLIKTVGGGQNGLKITLDLESNTVKFTRRMYITDNKKGTEFVELLFYTDSFDVLMAIQKPSEDTKYDYPEEISAFLSSLDPDKADRYLVLANKQNQLGKSYSPSDLKQLECRTAADKKVELCATAADALYAMMKAMELEGIVNFSVTSGYRSYSYQAQLFEKYINDHMTNEGLSREEAEAKALTYSAPAGASEHQTGLCVDFLEKNKTDLDESFEKTDAFKWLSENAYKYGFILRYPRDKAEITEYQYEPWHYRFVGRTAAAEIYSSGLCLEEYLALN